MNEDFLHYIWKMQLFRSREVETTDGEKLIILHAGELNKHAGPDFTNAKIKIGDTLWFGNVEIHIKSSDWRLHGHQNDEAYDSVILHVVYEHDTADNSIPTFILQDKIDSRLIFQYKFMMETSSWVPSEKHIHKASPLVINHWLSRLLAERLEQKALNIEQRLLVNKNDWEETCYQLIARNLGTNINADPFERVARSLPLNIIRKHLNNPFQVEALYFGQAGFIQGNFKELYPHRLQAEYRFLKKKYNLEGIRPLEWKFLRLRPANFPTIRMSQFASITSGCDKIFSKMLAAASVNEIRKLFNVSAADFWKEHYHFKKSTPIKSAVVGKDTVELIIINSIAPLLYLYGKKAGNEDLLMKAVAMLENIPAENNSVIKKWSSLGIKAQHAGHSQALLQLKHEYCDKKRCLECAIGHQILKSENNS